MTDDKIAEIRARHDAVHNVLRGASQMHADRGYLLTEVERLTRERDEARAALKPFASLFLWPDDLDASSAADIRAEEDWSQAENDENTHDVFIKRRHIRAAREALEAKP